MKVVYFNPLKQQQSLVERGAGRLNPIVETQFQKAMNLQSLFNPSETMRLEQEIQAVTQKSKVNNFSKRSQSTRVDFNATTGPTAFVKKESKAGKNAWLTQGSTAAAGMT